MSKPQQLGLVLSKILKTSGIDKGIKQRQAILIWDKVVGQKMASQSKAIKVEESKIFVKVKNPVWRSEILLMKNQIMEALNKSLGQQIIKDVIVLGE